MSNAADDKRLAELLVDAGKLTSKELLACLEQQRQLGGPERKTLGEILVDRGLLSAADLEDTLVRSAPTRDVATAAAPGALLLGRYEIRGELGRGGMGAVYRGYDPQLQRDVAIKLISGEGAIAGSQAYTRFLREARVTARLRHRGIVSIHEVGEHDGQPLIVMDLVEGMSLEELVRREPPPPVRAVVEMAAQVAEALHHAHGQGVVHRDVKPANILVEGDGQALLVDFGIARDLAESEGLTATGEVIGSIFYLAPEQAGASGLKAGSYTDVYALGATLYRALAGRPPFVGDSHLTVIKQVLMDDPLSLRRLNDKVHPDLDTMVLKCLEKDPRRRYPSAAALAEDLRSFVAGEPINARPLGGLGRATRWAGRNRALSGALVALVVVMCGALAGGVGLYRRSQRELLEERIESARRQERTKLEATLREDQARQDAAQRALHEQAAAALVELEAAVEAVLQQAREGTVFASDYDRQQAYDTLLSFRDSRTVEILSAELDVLGAGLAERTTLSAADSAFVKLLCQALAGIGRREEAVASLGRYLQVELGLPRAVREELRAVPAGLALCRLGGESADVVLQAARDGFGVNGPFWGQVRRVYRLTGVTPRLHEETALGFFNRGMLRMDKGDLDGANHDFTRAIELDPGLGKARSSRALTRRKVGNLDGAIADLNIAVGLEPNNARNWTNRGAIRMEQGNLTGALADLSRSIELNPDTAKAWFNLAAVRVRLDDADGALADLARCIEIDPRFAGAWSNRGMLRIDRGDLDGAASDYTRAIELDPSQAETWNNRGRLRHERRNFSGAVADYTRALELDPGFVKAWNNRGITRAATGDLEGAVADHSRALALDPSYVPAWVNRGNVRLNQGDVTGAGSDFGRALVHRPHHPQALNGRAVVRSMQGDFSGAIADLGYVIEMQPLSPKPWNNRGNARASSGDLKGAVSDYTRAIELDPGYPDTWKNRGLVRVMLRDLEGAIADWQQFLELVAPNHPDAKIMRGNIVKARQSLQVGAGDDR